VGPRLTDDCNVSEHWENTAPRDSTQVGPLLIHLSWGTGQELIQDLEDDKTNDLRNDPSSYGQALNNKVRDVKVGRCWDLLGEYSCDSAGVLGECLHQC